MNKEEIEKQIQKLEEQKQEIVKNIIKKTKNPITAHKLFFSINLYSICLIFISSSILLPVLMIFLFKVHWLITLIVSLFMFPLFILSIALFFIKLYMDKNDIKSFLTKQLSRNYIKANIWFPQKIKMEYYTKIDSVDAIGFNLGKQRYFVDSEAVYKNKDGISELDYLYNIPNPIKYKHHEIIKEFQKAFNEGKLPFKYKNQISDISLSSEQVQEFKKMKMFLDFKDTTQVDSTYTKLLFISMGLNALFIIGLVIMQLVG